MDTINSKRALDVISFLGSALLSLPLSKFTVSYLHKDSCVCEVLYIGCCHVKRFVGLDNYAA